MFASGVVSLAADLVKLVAITGILFWMNWRLALATLAVAPPLFLIVRRVREELRIGFREVRTRIARLNAYLAEALSGMDLVQVFSQEKRIQTEFAKLGDDYRQATFGTVKHDAILYAVVEFFSAVAVAIILWYGGIRIVAGSLTFGELVAFTSYIQMFFDPIRDLSAKYATMQSGMASLERIFSLRDENERIPDVESGNAEIAPPHAEAVSQNRGAEIQYRGVWFTYQQPGTRIDGEPPELNWALRGLSFHASPGERIALVGATGSGKSTTIKLLNRFYDAQQGEILFGGVDIRTIPLQALRRRIGVVSQDVFLFSGTLLDNIRLFDPSISRERAEAAAATVGLLPMLERLGRRLDEPVLERGRNFSQGQRQLVSFARVLAFDPDVLVLDEATSSVDQETEHIIQQALEKIMVGRTSLIVAHRLATIRHCDRILVLHHGELRESGSHQELVEQRGIYEKLHRLQAAAET
jgi:ATP-binding cassette subfamily B protein